MSSFWFRSSNCEAISLLISPVNADLLLYFGKSLLEKAQEKSAEFTKQIGTTHSPWVKIRNSAEIGVITVLFAGASAGVAQAVKELGEKVK
jgi:hypothetical protein